MDKKTHTGSDDSDRENGDRFEESDSEKERRESGGDIADQRSVKLKWFFNFSEALQTATTLSLITNDERRNEASEFADIPEHEQLKVLHERVDDFISILPMAEVSGINLFISLIGGCAHLSKIEEIIENIEMHNAAVIDKNAEEKYEKE